MRAITPSEIGPLGRCRPGCDRSAASAGDRRHRCAERLVGPADARREIATGTVFMNRCDYLDPALVWTGVKDTGKGASLSVLGIQGLTRPKSYHLKIIS